MLTTRSKYFFNEKRRKQAPILTAEDYRPLLQRLQDLRQDLEDALELDQAVETATNFREYAEVRAELQNEGKL